MPSSVLNESLAGLPPHGYRLPSYRPDDVLIGPLSICAVGDELIGVNSPFWQGSFGLTTGQGIFYPFALGENYLCRKLWWFAGGGGSAGLVDVGVYREDCSLVVSAGSTAASISNVIQEFDVTDTLLTPGRYWCGISADSSVTSTTTVYYWNGSFDNALMAPCGIATQTSGAFPLPSTFTPASVAPTSTILPAFGIAARLQVG